MAPLGRAIVLAEAQLAQATPSPHAYEPSPTPSASGLILPNATPTPGKEETIRGGPVRFSLNGSLSLGERSATQTLNGTGGLSPTPTPTASGSPSPFIGPGGATISTQNQAITGVGLFAELDRRTALTSTDVKVPFAFSSGGQGLIGATTVLYSTPKYGLGYGPTPLTLLGQLPVGSTIRSYYGILPTHNGETTFYEGPTIGAQGEEIPIEGMQWRESAGNSIYEGGLVYGDGPFTGKSETAIFGDAVSLGPLTAIGEGAYQTRSGGDQDASGLSYQFRADDGNTNTYLTGILRHISDGFVSFGDGEIYGDDYFSLAYHRATALQNFTFNASTEQAGALDGPPLLDRIGALAYNGPLRFGGYSISLQSQRTGESGSTSSLEQGSTQISATIGKGVLLVGDLLSRTTTQIDGDESQAGYNAELQLPFRSVVAGLSFNNTRLTSQESGTSLTTSEGLNLSRSFGKAAITLSDIFAHAQSDISDALTTNLSVAVSRAISPVISVQALFGVQSLNDRINPVDNGRSKNFAIQINAPFSYGNGVVTGRADPRLPATIVGRVLTDTSANPTFAGIASGGVANVEVILDDKSVQRTDVSGNFQFSFVTPGQHQLSIENSSLPRGVTVNIPVNTIQVAGGQTAQVTFLVGTYGGITGHVYGRNDAGTIVPLPNVLVRVDGATYSQTDKTGAYGFGRLRPGKHTVSVVENSVPAFATFDSANDKQTVDVQNGQYATVDFTALPLGSISGSILFGSDMGYGPSVGVPNAYVVAEPGEHAAIDNDDGSFVIDDLPPGDYTVSVDPETVPEGLGIEPDSIAITLQSQEHYQGAAFVVGHTEKKVTFSFVGGGVSAASAPRTRLSESRLPPRGYTTVTVDAPKSAGLVSLELFGEHVAFTYDDKAAVWSGAITVPTSVKGGSYAVSTKVENGTQPQPATLTVDPKMPLAILQTEPSNPQIGAYVRVRARFLVDARPGDHIVWADGQITTLGKPIAGRVFTFSIRFSLRPLHGVLRAQGASLPISLM
ncbi:MAG TPA: hypothetical protein VMF11_06230 [Candidatus Baltobacteraceae bacterium]|nr:hypothetical protein [Candidatus Baltobacteraceae bacterium]